MHSWTGNLLSTPLAADFGPCTEAALEGRSAGQGVCFLCLSPPTSGLARRGRRKGVQVDGKFAFHAPSRAGPEGAAERWHTKRGVWFSSSLGVTHCFRVLRPGDNGEGAYGQRVCILAPLANEPRSSGRWRPGWKDCCCGWLWRVLLAILQSSAPQPSRVLCCRLCLTFTRKKKEKKRKKTGMERSGPTPSALPGR